MGLAWSEDMSVGNATIDSDHKRLIAMVKDVGIMIKMRDNFILAQAFELLEHYLCVHFANEERIVQAIKFPFARYRLAQQYVLKEFRHMKDELIDKNGKWSDDAAEHYSNFLNDWIIDHIIKKDMLMKSTLRAYSYDFEPCREASGHPEVQ